MTSETPEACWASQATLVNSSSTSTAPSAASSHASRPGRTCRWNSASSAVSVRRGSITMIERAGSLAMFLSVSRAWGMLCDCHGFLPTNRATSQCSKSPRTGVPNMSPLTQISPVFSCAMALERNFAPNALSVAVL